MAIGNTEHVCGLIALGDAVRPDARSVIEHLRHAGVDRLVRDRMVSRAEDYLVSGELSSSGSRLNEAARCAEAVLDRLEVRRLKAA